MVDFTKTTYLKNGNSRQQMAHGLLKKLGVFSSYAIYNPVLTGTIPIGIDLPDSDLDVILQAEDLSKLELKLKSDYAKKPGFYCSRKLIRGEEVLITRFSEGGEKIELFAHPSPVTDQYAYRHMVQEYRCLEAATEDFKRFIIKLKDSGYNTEAAFKRALELNGDEFIAILELEKRNDLEIKELILGSYYGIVVRTITPGDDNSLGDVIRICFLDYDATQQGTVFSDPVIDQLYDSFSDDRSKYFVAEKGGKVLGGAGIQELKEGPPGVCELQKMYLLKEARGIGLGSFLLEKCLDYARSIGYSLCYLESLPELKDALRLYEKAGFQYRNERLGMTGYFGCSLYMTKDL